MGRIEIIADTMAIDVQVALIILAVCAVIAMIVVFFMKSAHKTAKPQRAACNYVRKDSFNLTTQRDLFLFRRITKIPKPQQQSGGRRR